jgi:SAM-dependent methyltransferase
MAAMNPCARRAPRIWQPDWYVLRGLAQEIRATLGGLELRGCRVLDFGCGARPYEPWFVAAGARYAGADLGGAHEVSIGTDGRLGAGDASADLVVSFQVLEHVWDVARYLAEARRVLVPGGSLLLSTHGTWLYHPHPGDYRRWTAQGLKREVEAAGFALVAMRPVAGPLAWTTVLRAVGLCHFLARLPLVGGALAAATAVLLGAKAWLEDRLTPAAVLRDNACVYVCLFRRMP